MRRTIFVALAALVVPFWVLSPQPPPRSGATRFPALRAMTC